MYYAIWSNKEIIEVADITDFIAEVLDRLKKTLVGDSPKAYVLEKAKEMIKATMVIECEGYHMIESFLKAIGGEEECKTIQFLN